MSSILNHKTFGLPAADVLPAPSSSLADANEQDTEKASISMTVLIKLAVRIGSKWR
jgi:hypothetical protein